MQSATADSDRRSADDVAEVAGAADRRQSRRPRATLALTLAMFVVLGICARPAYRYWHHRRTAFYKEASQEAVQSESWNVLHTVASAWLGWDDRSDDARMYVSEAAQKLGRIEEAVAELGRVSDDYPGALQALAIRGDTLFSDLNRPYEAVEAWERMLRVNPRADLARQRLIYFHAMTLQREKMIQGIYEAMELGCEPPEAYAYLLLAYEVMFSDGLRLTKQWMQSSPGDETLKVAHAVYLARFSPENTINIYGMSLITAGDETLIDESLTRYPHNLEVLAYHLERAVVEGDHEAGLKLLGQCPPEAERDARFWRYRGWYLATDGRFAEAEQAVRTALELYPFDWRSRLQLSGVLRRLDRTVEAAEEARIADLGKELHRELLQLPNARSLTASVEEQIDEYLALVEAPLVRRAWQKRASDGR